MNRFIKACLTAALICIFAGGAIAVVSSAFGGNVMDVLPEPMKQWKTQLGDISSNELFDQEDFLSDKDFGYYMDQGEIIYTTEGVKELHGDITLGMVLIKDDSPDETITINSNQEASGYEITEEDGTLTLSNRSGKKKRRGDDILFTIHIPKNYEFSRVDFDLHRSGMNQKSQVTRLTLSAKGLNAVEMDLAARGGAIRIEQGKVGTFQSEVEAGALAFAGAMNGDVSVKCRAGAVSLNPGGKKEDFNYDLNCKLGAVKLGEDGMSVLESSNQFDHGAEKDMNLDVEVGAIKVNYGN